jgi:glycosyltransferase involved in cell wall biosynthesis
MSCGYPLVSIVTPSLNQGSYIEQTLRSVRDQTYPRIEHIVVDGGSTDGTLDVLRRFEDTYALRWLSEPDGGMYEAVNKGLCLAHGGILAYLNSDDRYLPWTVATAVRSLLADPQAGFVFGDMVNLDEQDGSMRLWLYPPFSLDYIRRTGFLGQPTVFWRRQVLDELGGFDESLKLLADCDYWMRVGARYQGCKVNEVLAIERDHPRAKRLAEPRPFADELTRVRSRHTNGQGRADQLKEVAGRLYAFAWRRYYLLRLVSAASGLRVRSRRQPGGWAGLLDPGSELSLVRWRVFGMLIPFMGGRFSQGAVRERGPTFAEGAIIATDPGAAEATPR